MTWLNMITDQAVGTAGRVVSGTPREKIETKERKLEKIELKERKREKNEIKEFEKVPDKHRLENEWVEGPERPGDIVVNPELEGRLTDLERTLSELRHFIVEGLRPDLSQGALRAEQDLAALHESQEDEANLARLQKMDKDLEKLSEQPPDDQHDHHRH